MGGGGEKGRAVRDEGRGQPSVANADTLPDERGVPAFGQMKHELGAVIDVFGRPARV